jgi:deazaflavin-dependent oxidoreductase (nitroreductase family)
MGWYDRAAVVFASSRPGAWFFVHVAMRLDRLLVPLTRGRVSSCLGTRYQGRHLLLLTTMGARSGRPRTVPLLYVRDGRDIVLVGSKGGDPRHPAWIHNVRANSRVTVYARGQRGDYTAREAQGEERRRLWARAVELYPGYETYRARAAGREIPVVVLSPTSRAATRCTGGAPVAE